MGLTNLESAAEFIAVNRRNYQQYKNELGGIDGLRFLAYDETERCNYQYVVLQIDADVTGVSRDQVMQVLHGENILARRYFYPGCHRMEPYKSLFPHAGLLLPETEKLTRQVLCLPTGTAVGEAEVKAICEIIELVISNPSEVNNRLQAAASHS